MKYCEGTAQLSKLGRLKNINERLLVKLEECVKDLILTTYKV